MVHHVPEWHETVLECRANSSNVIHFLFYFPPFLSLPDALYVCKCVHMHLNCVCAYCFLLLSFPSVANLRKLPAPCTHTCLSDTVLFSTMLLVP